MGRRMRLALRERTRKRGAAGIPVLKRMPMLRLSAAGAACVSRLAREGRAARARTDARTRLVPRSTSTYVS